jgi:hypothetical protein
MEPDALNLDASRSIHVSDYKYLHEIYKQQIALNKDTFSFLHNGAKEVYFDNSTHAIDNSKFPFLKYRNCLVTKKKFQRIKSL